MGTIESSSLSSRQPSLPGAPYLVRRVVNVSMRDIPFAMAASSSAVEDVDMYNTSLRMKAISLLFFITCNPVVVAVGAVVKAITAGNVALPENDAAVAAAVVRQ
eukprot:3229013-Ditylum_brightwellii.AAC.1